MKYVETKIDNFRIRYAEKKDAQLIVDYIRDLAEFEGELEYVKVTKEILEENLFDKQEATVILGEYFNKPVGFALFHYTFSTFLGKRGIGLVDLYIEPEMRNRGFGKTMLSYLAKLTVENDCGRLEWWCHDWNDKAIKRYKKWGAVPIDNIRVYRMHENGLTEFAEES